MQRIGPLMLAPLLLALWTSPCIADEAPAVPLEQRSSAPDRPIAEPLGPTDLAAALDSSRATYPIQKRVVGNPGDINIDLATSFPRRNALLPQIAPEGLFRLKKRLYDSTGIQFAVSYQALIQRYSSVLPSADGRTGAGGWLLIEAKWDLLNRGGDYEGSLQVALDWRHELFGQTNPTEMQVASGSGYGTGALYFEWDPSITTLFWQQWFGKETLEVRLGKQAAGAIFDFFRFKDARVSGMSDPVHLDLVTVPAPPPGYGVSFKWWPVKRGRLKSLYAVGTVNDMNGEPEELSPESLSKGQFFYGVEVGFNWKRKFPIDFDHAHVSLWYADERTDGYYVPPILPNKAGWGFKVAGEKQFGRLVGFGKYAYNTAEGGGLGVTFSEQTATLGAVYLNPFDVKGEVGAAAMWMHPLFGQLRDQYGVDLYWRVLLTPNLWVTPGVQLVWDPSLDPTTDFLAVPGLKMRWFW